jgi:GxxExxY protein
MSESESKLRCEAETEAILNCAFEVLNALGHGLLEKPYENALAVEFQLRGIPFQQQPSFPITYKTFPIGVYVPDLIVFDSVIVDTKTIERIGNLEIGQIVNYLKITGLTVGLILNFKRPKLEWKRVVL